MFVLELKDSCVNIWKLCSRWIYLTFHKYCLQLNMWEVFSLFIYLFINIFYLYLLIIFKGIWIKFTSVIPLLLRSKVSSCLKFVHSKYTEFESFTNLVNCNLIHGKLRGLYETPSETWQLYPLQAKRKANKICGKSLKSNRRPMSAGSFCGRAKPAPDINYYHTSRWHWPKKYIYIYKK